MCLIIRHEWENPYISPDATLIIDSNFRPRDSKCLPYDSENPKIIDAIDETDADIKRGHKKNLEDESNSCHKNEDGEYLDEDDGLCNSREEQIKKPHRENRIWVEKVFNHKVGNGGDLEHSYMSEKEQIQQPSWKQRNGIHTGTLESMYTAKVIVNSATAPSPEIIMGKNPFDLSGTELFHTDK